MYKVETHIGINRVIHYLNEGDTRLVQCIELTDTTEALVSGTKLYRNYAYVFTEKGRWYAIQAIAADDRLSLSFYFNLLMRELCQPGETPDRLMGLGKASQIRFIKRYARSSCYECYLGGWLMGTVHNNGTQLWLDSFKIPDCIATSVFQVAYLRDKLNPPIASVLDISATVANERLLVSRNAATAITAAIKALDYHASKTNTLVVVNFNPDLSVINSLFIHGFVEACLLYLPPKPTYADFCNKFYINNLPDSAYDAIVKILN